jgi:alpha-glucosidase (family GH31 glycosyl hydrolase)
MKPTLHPVRSLVGSFLLPFLWLVTPAQAEYSPIANPSAVVRSLDVRFTVLTPMLIRMEWEEAGRFEDRASLLYINRALPVPQYSKSEKDGYLVIQTDKLELRYKLGSGKFTSQNLQVSLREGQDHTVWKPGDKNEGNLKGTYRTLDGCRGSFSLNDQKEIVLEDGLLSSSGWFLSDDSANFLFDGSEWSWVQPRPAGDHQDWYFFGYGRDYKSALRNFTRVAGKIPLPPRFAFGYWWSRYWNYSDRELRELVADLHRYQVPCDVLVVDMDWHTEGWTGYTWNRSLFPEPAAFLSFLHEQGLKTTLNLHPADGVQPTEEKYAEFARAMDFNVTDAKAVPFEAADKRYMSNLFKIILHPLERQGVDFWWLDWQQWPNSRQLPQLSNTWWLNYCFFSDMEREGAHRPLIYHRWGGMGNHRYQIGFSGDTLIDWNSLAYQPYFTSTAANVGYGYWSHDIGGHMLGSTVDPSRPMDPELYTRWLQFATFSPIFRTHSTKDARIRKEVWIYPPYYRGAMFDAISLRYALAPYIYTMARKTYDTGVSLCHPMYYEYPGEKEAYAAKDQYMFGDDLIVRPVTSPESHGLATVKVWLPEGYWYEWFTGTMLKGGQTHERSFMINQVPVYVRAGAIVPEYPRVENLKQNPDKIIVRAFPGGGSASRMYEDQGDSLDYQNNGYAFTRFQTVENADGSLTLTVFPREGSYAGMADARSYEIQFPGRFAPSRVSIDGNSMDYSPDSSAGTWSYSGSDLTTHVYVPSTQCINKVTVTVAYAPEALARSADLNGVIGRMARLTSCVRLLKSNWKGPGPLPAMLAGAELTDIKIDYHPAECVQDIEAFLKNYAQLQTELKTLPAAPSVLDEAGHLLN